MTIILSDEGVLYHMRAGQRTTVSSSIFTWVPGFELGHQTSRLLPVQSA